MGAGLRNAFVGNPAQSGITQIGTYVGDGNAGRAIAVPFAPDIVEIFQHNAAGGRIFHGIKTAAMGTANIDIVNPGTVQSITDGITALGATSFTITIGNGYNDVGVTYTYRAQRGGTFP